jgi:hypothetical protein
MPVHGVIFYKYKLHLLQQAIAGYQTVSLNATTRATPTNGALSDGKNAVIELTSELLRKRKCHCSRWN